MITLALIRDTFREALARRIFLALFGFSTLMLLFFLFIMKIDVVEGALATVSLFGWEGRAQEVSQVVRNTYAGVSAFLYGIGMFLAAFASAGLIPTIFEPGRIELLLSKPVSRAHILIGRYLGNLAVITANVIFLSVGIWVIFGYKTGIWPPEFLFAVGLTIFGFATLLTVILLVAVLSESAVLSTIATFGLMTIGTIVAQQSLLERLLNAEWARSVVRVLYAILPKIWDLGNINRKLVNGIAVEDWSPLWSTAGFGAVVFALAVFCFQRRNY